MFRLQRVDQEQGLVKVLIIIIQVFRIQFRRQTFRVHSSPLDQVYNLIYFAAFHPPHPHHYLDHIYIQIRQVTFEQVLIQARCSNGQAHSI